ncbi:hypothetical protein [Streptosporangium sp. H16]|uniref:hypothetical protein n=1 Tax=Streptosporangium sp. H16 TaxID=3444184 RepID=UPI003F7AB1A1
MAVFAENSAPSQTAVRFWARVSCALAIPAWLSAVQVAALVLDVTGRQGRLVVPVVVMVVCAALWWLERLGGSAVGVAVTGGAAWLLASVSWGQLGATVLIALSLGLLATLTWSATLTK